MGNSAAERASKHDSPFIKAIKLHQQNCQEALYEDMSNQIEQVFGINSIPVSHRADIAESIARSVGLSIKSDDGIVRGRQYQERISNLESEILYLKSLIEESKYRSRQGSPVRSEAEHSESSSQIQNSTSRLSRTYFQSRSDEGSVRQGQE